MKALYLLLAVSLAVAFAFTVFRIKRTTSGLTPLLGWILGLTYFIVLPLLIITLNGGYRSPQSYEMNGWGDVDLTNLKYFRPYLLTWFSVMLSYAVAYFLPSAEDPMASTEPLISRKKLERALLVTMAISLVDWAVLIWLAGGLDAFLVSHWYNRIEDLVEQYGAIFVLSDHLSEANQIVFTGAAVLYTSLGLRNRDTRPRLTLLIILFLLLEVVMSGNRIFFALYLLGFLASSWIFKRKKIIVAMLLASPALALIFGAWAAVRHDLTNITESATTYVQDDSVSNRAVTGMMGITEGTDVVLLMHIIGDFGGRFDYLYGSTYGRLFTFFVPRSLYANRTRDFTTLAANLYEPGEVTSLASTVLGEAYANFGVLGIFLLPLVTWITCRYTQHLAESGASYSLASGVSFVMLIWFARGTFAESVILFLGATLLIAVFHLERGLRAPVMQPE